MADRAPRRSDAEERLLLARVARRDEEAFAELYNRYATALYSVALGIVRDGREAEEVVQDAFVRVWKKAHTYDPAGARPFRWVFLITRRLCLSRLRVKKNHMLAPVENEDFFASRASTDHEVREQEERREAIRRLLGELAPEQRECLEMALFTGMTHQEIAERMSRPLGTVKAWIRRGLLKIRDDLEEATR